MNIFATDQLNVQSYTKARYDCDCSTKWSHPIWSYRWKFTLPDFQYFECAPHARKRNSQLQQARNESKEEKQTERKHTYYIQAIRTNARTEASGLAAVEVSARGKSIVHRWRE